MVKLNMAIKVAMPQFSLAGFEFWSFDIRISNLLLEAISKITDPADIRGRGNFCDDKMPGYRLLDRAAATALHVTVC